MILRRIIAALAIVCAFVLPAQAQKTKALLNTEIGVLFPDNTQGAITPQVLRGVTGDIVNSIMPTAPVVSGNLPSFNGTTGLLQDSGIPGAGSFYPQCAQDAVTDCSAAFNAAVAAASAYSQSSGTPFGTQTIGGTVYVPPGPCFRIHSATITLLKGVNLIGAGGLASCIIADDVDAVTLNYSNGFGQPTISGLSIWGENASAARHAIIKPDTLNDAITMNGLNVRDVTIQNFDTAIYINAAQNNNFLNIRALNVNNCIAGVGTFFNSSIYQVNCTYGTGSLPTASPGTGLSLQSFNYTSGSGVLPPEGNTIIKSQIFGFNIGIDIGASAYFTADQINLVAKQYGIRYTQVTDDFTFTNNNVEIQGSTATTGIWAKGCSGASCMSTDVKSLIQGNQVQATLGAVSATGIQVNDGSTSQNNNVTINANIVTGMQVYDYAIYNPGNVQLLHNVGLSSGTTNCMLIGVEQVGINLVNGNYCASKAITYSTASDLTSGLTRHQDNLINGGTLEAPSWNVQSAVAPFINFTGPTALRNYALPDAAGTIAMLNQIQTWIAAQTFGTLVATTINGNTITTGTGTLTLGAGKTATISNTLTFAGTDGSTLNVGTGGTLGGNAFTSTAYAPLASPALTGTPTAPTAAVDTNTAQLATTAMVLGQAASATPLAPSGAGAVGTSTRYARADHVHPASNTNANLLLSTSNVNPLVANTTFFAGTAVAAGNEATAQIPVSAPATLKNLYVTTQAAPAGVQTQILTLRKNGVSQTLTCTITGAATTCNDTTHTVAVVAGDLIDVQIVTSATAATSTASNMALTAVTTSP